MSLALLTDYYQLSMGYGYWKSGLAERESVFHLFFRRRPFEGGFTIAAGLEAVVDYLDHFQFTKEDLAYLKDYFPSDFLKYLRKMRFKCSVEAVPEGTAVFPYEPLLRIQGPLIQCQILESPLLNLINFPTLIATKAARLCIAAGNDEVMEFGLRRAQGVDGALTASRASYIGGCHATSNVLAGMKYGIPVRGTHSHSWVMAFEDEQKAFQTFAEELPKQTVFLVDTYDTVEGVKRAIEVGKWLKSQDQPFVGIRLDSGDLADLSIKARHLLDQAGFSKTQIIASNELDETLISELKRQGAKIDIWGVGTNLVTAKDQPALDGVYKLSAIRDEEGEWRYTLKLSEQMLKISNPGILQVRRFYRDETRLLDVIYDVAHSVHGDWHVIDPFDPTMQGVVTADTASVDLLVPIYKQGKRVYELPSLISIRERTRSELAHFPVGIKRFLNPHRYFVGMEQHLYEIKVALIKKIRKQQHL